MQVWKQFTSKSIPWLVSLCLLTVFVMDARGRHVNTGVSCVGCNIGYEYKSASQLLKQFQLGWLVDKCYSVYILDHPSQWKGVHIWSSLKSTQTCEQIEICTDCKCETSVFSQEFIFVNHEGKCASTFKLVLCTSVPSQPLMVLPRLGIHIWLIAAPFGLHLDVVNLSKNTIWTTS